MSSQSLDEAAASIDALMDASMRWVGARLRSVREQRQLSLDDVERLSHGEFGPSTIAAYERGDRTISLPRLDRLSDFYAVPIEQFLPQPHDRASITRRSAFDGERMVIDVEKLAVLTGHPFEPLARFVDLVREQRKDWKSSVVTLRRSDAVVVAAILGVPVTDVSDRLVAFDLRGSRGPGLDAAS